MSSNTLRAIANEHVGLSWIASEHPGRRAKSLKCYTSALNRFKRFLGHEPQVTDLDAKTFFAFREWLDANYGRGVRAETPSRILRLWRIAYRLKLTTSPPATRRATMTAAEVEPSPGSLVWLFKMLYVPLRLRTRSRRTIDLYYFTIRNFGRYLKREAMLTDLTDQVVSGLLSWMANDGRSPYTVNKERDQLLAIWRFAARKKLVDQWPEVERGKLPQRIPRAWTQDDLAKLWKALGSAPGTIGGILASDWWIALHFVLWYSAQRISAVRQLRWADFDGEWLVFRAETTKGGLADQAVLLPPAAVAALERIREPKRELIFPWEWCPTYIYRRYAKLLTAAGLPTDAKSKFHRMRKSAASHFEAANGNATALLAHSSRKVTLAYLDPRIVKPPQAADKLFTPGRAQGGAA